MRPIKIVKARRVGGAVVMTIPQDVLRQLGIKPGDPLVVKVSGSGFRSAKAA